MDNPKHLVLPNQIIKFEDVALECIIENNQQPVIKHGKQTFKTLYSLVEAFPEINKGKNIEAIVKAANFLSQGMAYQYIDNITAYKEAYLNRIEYEKNSLDYMPVRLIDHGIFDVSIMHPPRIIGNELVFFVQDDRSGIPYRVTLPYPITQTAKGTYRLLPYLEE